MDHGGGRTYGGQSVTSDAAGNILAVAHDRKAHVIAVELPISIATYAENER